MPNNSIAEAISSVITEEIKGEIELSRIRTEFRIEQQKVRLQQQLFAAQIQQLQEIRELLHPSQIQISSSDDDE